MEGKCFKSHKGVFPLKTNGSFLIGSKSDQGATFRAKYQMPIFLTYFSSIYFNPYLAATENPTLNFFLIPIDAGYDIFLT